MNCRAVFVFTLFLYNIDHGSADYQLVKIPINYDYDPAPAAIQSLIDVLPQLITGNKKSLFEIDTLVADVITLTESVSNYIDPECAGKLDSIDTIKNQIQNLALQHSSDLGCDELSENILELNEKRSDLIRILDLLSVHLTLLPQDTAKLVSPQPKDCLEAQHSGALTGVTTIYPNRVDPKQVWCDQETNGGGWTVMIKRQRQDQQLDFQQRFDSYDQGFGSPSGEYWLGLKSLVTLTNPEPYELMVKMARGTEDAKSYYSSFQVESGSSAKLAVSGYDSVNSTGGDSLEYHNGQSFSTRDRDVDGASGGPCSDWSGGGGWWFNYCYFSNPTGLYGGNLELTEESDSYLEWRKWKGYYNFLTDFVMMIRPSRQ